MTSAVSRSHSRRPAHCALADSKVTPQATAERPRDGARDCLTLFEVASWIERQQKLLSALVPHERIIALQEFGNCLRRSRSMVAIHGVSIEVRVLDDKVAAWCD